MAAIVFPAPPTLHEEFTSGANTWKCVVVGPPAQWEIVPAATEPALGNPGTDGYVLSSTSAGARSWVPMSAGGETWLSKTSAYDAVAGDKIAANTSGGAFTINLPATPSAMDAVWFADSGYTWDSLNLTVGRNGSTINGSAADLVCNIRMKIFCMIYNGTTWRVLT